MQQVGHMQGKPVLITTLHMVSFY